MKEIFDRKCFLKISAQVHKATFENQKIKACD